MKISFFFALLFSTTTLFAQSEFSSSTISVGVVVSDLDKALKFYTEVIGMSETGGFDIPPELGKKTGLSNGEPFSVKVLTLNDEPDATQWKLMSFGKKAGHKKPTYIQDDTGVQYITIYVKRLTPFIERVKKADVLLLGDTPVQIPDGRYFILVQDPDGTFVELIGEM